jgi:alcohol dehydrogenase (cytochrome c)
VNWRAAVVAVCAASALSAQVVERKASVSTHAPLPKVSADRSTNWSDHNGDPANSRFSPLAEINTSNVGALALKWSYEAPKGEAIRQQTPLVVDGVMYFNSGSKLHALDAVTGTPVWSFDLDPPFPGGKRGPGYGQGTIYAFGDDVLFAVDAKTGKPVESFGDHGVLRIVQKALDFKYPGKYSPNVDMRRVGYSIGATPKYHDGTIYVGTSTSEQMITGGLLIAADARTGAIKWVFNTIPQGPGDDGWEITKDSWPAGGRRVGGGIWTQPAIDPALGMIYFNSTNPAPDYDGSVRVGMNLFTNSLIALDLATGKLRWYYQAVHHDIWDKDATAGPVLFDTAVDGRMVRGVGSSGKICYVYLFDRETGRPINPMVETPVPTATDVPGEQVWPTQPIPYTARNIPQQPFCAIYPRIDDPELAKRARPLFQPYLMNDLVIESPGQDGGSNYGGPAFSPRTGFFYVSGKNDAVSLRVKQAGDTVQPGGPSPGHFANAAEMGKTGMKWSQTIAAYEPATGRQVWFREFPTWTNASLLVTAGDVIFHGGGGAGDFYAFDARSGQQLLRYPGHFGPPGSSRSGIVSTPMSYRVNGKQYVAVIAASTVLAFALP